MTNHVADMRNSDVVVTCGGNNAENHPLTMIHIDDARTNKDAVFIVVDPRYTRSAACADVYSKIRPGTDVVFFGGLINYVIENELYHEDYIKNWTNAPFLVNDNFTFEDGYFSGWNEESGAYDKAAWAYNIEEEYGQWDTDAGGAHAWVSAPGVPKFQTPQVPTYKKDMTLEDPNTVFQHLKRHYKRYTPQIVEAVCGMDQAIFLQIAEIVGSAGAPDKAAAFTYAMGLNQHTTGTSNIRSLAILQLLLGNIGVAGGGVNALRGESNVQGSTDFGLLFDQMTGYASMPFAHQHPDLGEYLSKTTTASGYYANRPKFVISLLKEMWGENSTSQNDYGFDWLPKLPKKNLSYMAMFEDMYREDDLKVLCIFGQNPLVGGNNVNVIREGLSKLDLLVCADLWETETSAFWKAPGVDSSAIDTEVLLLPMAASFEKHGSVTNTGRWAQWRWKAVEPLGDCIDDLELFTRIFVGVKNHYLREPGILDDPITKMSWPYVDEYGHADARKVARAINGYNVDTGEYLDTFGKLQADGSTACGCWIYTGYYANNDSLDASHQQTGSRNFKDYGIDGLTGGVGLYPDWSFAWPANRRILYNRASADIQGKPYNPAAPLVAWNGERWLRNDVPDFAFTNADGSHRAPDETVAYMMNTENVALIYSSTVNDGPFPEHYEPYESPTMNALNSVQVNPAALIFDKSTDRGSYEDYPIVCTTYRLSEHWQAGAMTRNKPWTAECQPHMFVEMSQELATRLHLENGDLIEVYNNRGSITTNLMITKRFKPSIINGVEVDTVGMPWHYGFSGMSSTGATANTLTPSVGDANSYIPEYKAFLVNIRKAGR